MIRIKNLHVPYDAAQPLAMLAAERLSLPVKWCAGCLSFIRRLTHAVTAARRSCGSICSTCRWTTSAPFSGNIEKIRILLLRRMRILWSSCRRAFLRCAVRIALSLWDLAPRVSLPRGCLHKRGRRRLSSNAGATSTAVRRTWRCFGKRGGLILCPTCSSARAARGRFLTES